MAQRRTARRDAPAVHRSADGRAELHPDPEREHGWLLTVEGVPQSYVDLADPTYLDFEYMRMMGDVVDCLGDGRAPLDVVHIGGGACTLARYVAATRPGSRQLVLEPDAALINLVREHLPLRSVRGLRVRITDGRAGLAALPDACDDLVILDAFADTAIPRELICLEFCHDVRRVLRPAGVYLLNMADGNRLEFARRVTATVRRIFPHTVLLAEPGVMRGRRFGNLVLAASAAALPEAELTRRAASGLVRARCLDTEALSGFCAGAAPLRQNEDISIPVPPKTLFGRP
ncbi:spermidine synthase [Thermomonospora curvata]|uniref:Spermidine synthase-like protein n=1 Tax=Thermomonospora curvata (strain ATCC 19995 / DSM 43183 / JCM 3096 / KCTC 9072 / NBRC 15933 / NCIMB 10081 / Henssen B9) TaxID=471852 RepID=D1AER6_THECD|nr:fused MFS/spermidine synthase [Thermomonospora curvata]ACY97641.1 Spermidine synthase-like protein [Thermomonospora curvata DSM 43183]